MMGRIAMRILVWLITSLLIVASALAQDTRTQFHANNVAVVGGGGADSCTGTLIFSWHAETTDVTTGTPVGCSVGDTTATASNGATPAISTAQFEDGTHAALFSATYDQYSFSVSTEDIIKSAAGTIDIWVRYPTVASSYAFSAASGTGGNAILIRLSDQGGGVFKINFDYEAGAQDYNVLATLSIVANTWYHVIAKWDHTPHSGNYQEVCADTSTGTTNCQSSATDINPTPWAGAISVLNFGDYAFQGQAGLYIDNVKIYSTWQ
jgi:hypothetical protein